MRRHREVFPHFSTGRSAVLPSTGMVDPTTDYILASTAWQDFLERLFDPRRGDRTEIVASDAVGDYEVKVQRTRPGRISARATVPTAPYTSLDLATHWDNVAALKMRFAADVAAGAPDELTVPSIPTAVDLGVSGRVSELPSLGLAVFSHDDWLRHNVNFPALHCREIYDDAEWLDFFQVIGDTGTIVSVVVSIEDREKPTRRATRPAEREINLWLSIPVTQMRERGADRALQVMTDRVCDLFRWVAPRFSWPTPPVTTPRASPGD